MEAEYFFAPINLAGFYSDPISVDEDKVHLVFEDGHFDFPRNTFGREISNKLDKYLGLEL